ncbi:hypothetical protein WBU96_28575 [Bacillus albus]|uniref:Phage protein n=1 Tax=Bacillus cereus TIAC219 TaxID=718222 RepID=A0ABC9SQN6_BACCE|nr:hypothetical protein [Bacillus cereus]EJP81096.1 hypothetical protein IC1_06677 [Bacillus cereus VD022]EOQ57873.1 hypothetical protein IAY_06213 [Bacillus cereus TIAC219]
MSYIVSTGTEAIEAALTEKTDTSKMLTSVKTGKVLRVRALPTAVVKYFAHSAYKVFYTTPCTKPSGKPDLYDLACDLLYKDAKAAEDAGKSEKEVKDIKDRAYLLKAKERYMIGFVNLEDGQPIIVDFTAKQGKAIVGDLQKYAKKLGKYPFELTKTGSSTDTQVSFSLVLDPEDDLKESEFAKFEESKDFEFPMAAFGEVLQVNDQEKQIEDLKAFGFDVSRLGIEEEKKEEGDNDTGF